MRDIATLHQKCSLEVTLLKDHIYTYQKWGYVSQGMLCEWGCQSSRGSNPQPPPPKKSDYLSTLTSKVKSTTENTSVNGFKYHFCTRPSHRQSDLSALKFHMPSNSCICLDSDSYGYSMHPARPRPLNSWSTNWPICVVQILHQASRSMHRKLVLLIVWILTYMLTRKKFCVCLKSLFTFCLYISVFNLTMFWTNFLYRPQHQVCK